MLTNSPARTSPPFQPGEGGGAFGIADALGVNDRRFLPAYEFAEPAKPGWVLVTVEPAA